MTTGISLLKITKNGNSKEKIIDILSNARSLSSKQIFEKLQREYSHNVTYQAVHKLLSELVEKNVLEKDFREYALKFEWIESNKKFFDLLVAKHSDTSKKEKKVSEEDGTLTLEYDSFSQVVVALAELFASKVLVGKSENILIGFFKYGYWPLNFKFNDFILLIRLLGQTSNGYPILKYRTPFGEWIMDQYIRAGAKGHIFDGNLELDKDMFVHGECIVEVTLEPEFENYLKETYGKLKNLNDLLIHFLANNEPKTKIKVKIMRNPTLAKVLTRQTMEKYFLN